ncbi:hypothetical protein [Streptomyces paludis]|uniref:C2H2-type domain-containing protein n=1 Tax=Streptomyces paludis TaxID=2282738 RepID=A0A345HSK0_9ACTN|nr:hypothetical protein [Streptomyces paludis]AXG79674.1 hypothetical protein DVK44_20745 [Streptomyces paludis]
MSEITGTAVAHEAYAFCCMHCGHGWEQSFDITHFVDGAGRTVVVYKADGVRVPSPLSSPTCVNCGGHVVRIMRSGQVSSVRALTNEKHHPAKTSRAGAEAAAAEAARQAGEPGGAISPVADGHGPGTGADHGHHHWHLSDLLHPFQHRHRG